MVHIKHVLPLKHFDLGNHRNNMYLHNACASTNMTHIHTCVRTEVQWCIVATLNVIKALKVLTSTSLMGDSEPRKILWCQANLKRVVFFFQILIGSYKNILMDKCTFHVSGDRARYQDRKVVKMFAVFFTLLSINTCKNASMKLIMVWFVHTKFCKQYYR